MVLRRTLSISKAPAESSDAEEVSKFKVRNSLLVLFELTVTSEPGDAGNLF